MMRPSMRLIPASLSIDFQRQNSASGFTATVSVTPRVGSPPPMMYTSPCRVPSSTVPV